MLIWIVKNWSYILVSILSFGLGYMIGHNIGVWHGKSLGRAEFKQEVTQEIVKVKVKNAEIRNHRPDNDALIKRLRSHTY